ncbi:MAG: hypothetical protein JSV96_19080 [Candidatus Aminicenantes bacterium]|nr:MAG: hypothetical protein JSV96_19080 [Candidatus Aminicenantes bacterium]
MKATMVVPSYWGRKNDEGWRKTDTVYDHPTPLDETGTLGRLLKSLSLLENKDFTLVVLGISTAKDIQEDVESKISSIIKEADTEVKTLLFSYCHLAKIHQYLANNDKEKLGSLLQLNGYSNVRNLCVFLPHLLGSEVAVLIDDDEIFEDPRFMDKALEFIGKEKDGDKILAVAGYYINPDNDFLINKKIDPWMTCWNKIDCMNQAFKEIIGEEPRLKETPFVFGGNMVAHRDLFTQVPFDPSITRGEDIDFLINARMFGFKFFLDNQLFIKHDAPPKTHPTWQRIREDILRFMFEKSKLETQESLPDMVRITAEDLDPYPGEFLKDDLVERILQSNIMLSIEYLREGDKDGALECLVNIHLAKSKSLPPTNPFQRLLQVQKNWKALMEYFASEKISSEVCNRLQLPRD